MSNVLNEGLGKIYYAVMTDESAETYGEVKPFQDLVDIAIKPTKNSKALYAGNKEYAIAYGSLAVSIDFTIPYIPDSARVDLFGYDKATTGGIIYNDNKVKPYLCLMMEQTLTDGSTNYIELFRGKLKEEEQSGKSKTDSPETDTVKLSGDFFTLKNGDWKYIVNSLDADFDATTFETKWGTEVIKPVVKTI